MSDRFEILAEISRDPVSTLCRAFDRKLRREVALKRLLPEAAHDPRFVARMRREARALAQVRSPHVLAVHEVGEDEEGPFLCIEPARGETLRARLERLGPLPVEEVVRLGSELCEALSAVHRARIVHRNVGLSQVVLDESGRAQLTGFALAAPTEGGPILNTIVAKRPGGGSTSLSPLLRVPGRPYAPEEGRGGVLEPRSDLYALAALLVECLAGPGTRAPEGPRDVGKLRALRPDLALSIEKALAKALSSDPEDRYASAADLAAALRPASVAGVSAGTGSQVSRRLRIAAVAGAAALGVVAIVAAFDHRAAPDDETRDRGIANIVPRDALKPYYVRSHALVIGIDKYQDPSWYPLGHAVADAQAVRDFLVQEESFADSDTVLLLDGNATRQRILDELRQRLAERSVVGPDDRVFVFFAGHGEQQPAPADGGDAQVGYLVPADATQSRSSFVTHADLLALCRTTPAKHVLLALDCCFSGWALTRAGGAPRDARFEALTREPVSQVLAAGSRGQTVGDVGSGSEAHSPFTRYLLRGLHGEAGMPDRGFVTASELSVYISSRVAEATAGEQVPIGGKLRGAGEFVFTPKPSSR